MKPQKLLPLCQTAANSSVPFQSGRPKQIPMQTVQILVRLVTSRLTRICTVCHSGFDKRLTILFAIADVSRFNDGRVHFRNSEMKWLKISEMIFWGFLLKHPRYVFSSLFQVSCGIWHGVAIDKFGSVYTWGYGRSHGVLGTGESPPLATPTLLRGPFTNKVMGVSCGNNYTLLWTTEGDAFSWGCGRHGVLGHGDTEDRMVPSKITNFSCTDKVIFMNAGFAHSGLITDKGAVYMFGKGEDGALGLGKRTLPVMSVPTQVTSCHDTVFVMVSCSVGEKHGHTLFLDSVGGVFSCGDGYKGKLGQGDQTSRSIPTQIPPDSFNKERIVSISAGGIHSAAVSQEGHVFTWGCGSDGRLGHPEGKGHRYLFRSDLPKVVEAFSSVGKALDVTCSYYHTVALIKSWFNHGHIQ